MSGTEPASGNGRRASAIITPTTLVPIGLAVLMIATALSLKTWIDAQFLSTSNDLRDIRYQMQLYERSLNEKTVSRWRSSDMRLWVSEFSRKNPALAIPEVNDIVNQDK